MRKKKQNKDQNFLKSILLLLGSSFCLLGILCLYYFDTILQNPVLLQGVVITAGIHFLFDAAVLLFILYEISEKK